MTPETDAKGQVTGCTAILEQEVLPRGNRYTHFSSCIVPKIHVAKLLRQSWTNEMELSLVGCTSFCYLYI